MLLCFFFNDTATTEIYTLSLHDALPIWPIGRSRGCIGRWPRTGGSASCCPSAHHIHPTTRRQSSRNATLRKRSRCQDRKSTRLNSSHSQNSYAVFCL